MKNVTLPVGSNRSSSDELLAFEITIDEYQSALNKEGVWLYLATLGCWSVTPVSIRIIALIGGFIIFGLRLRANLNDARSFKKLTAVVETRINEFASSEDECKARLYDLEQIKRQRLVGLNPYKKALGFLIGWTMFVAALLLSFVQAFGFKV
jgi:hypothetical protein